MKRINAKKIAVNIAIIVMTLLIACNEQPRTEVASATIERGIATGGGITQRIEGYKPVRVEFMVYNFGKLLSVSDPADYKEVSRWLVNYAHCYQNGVELERSFFYHYEEEFKEGKRCKITAFYQIPDDGIFEGINFKFNLEGLNVNYDGEFANNVNNQ
jgi:hypothetical protein